MEGKKERVMAAALCVLAIVLSAQRLPVCQCYVCCYQGCKVNDCSDCCADCYFPGDPDFENACRMSGGNQASVCGTEATGEDTICIIAEEGAAASYWSRRHIKAKAKHA